MTTEQQSPKRTPTPPYLREAIAIIIWAYALIKLFVFDIDTYLLSRLFPGSQWVLNLRLFGIASILAILWLALGHKRFLVSIAYITTYPLIIVFWKLPKLLLRQWAVVVILLPTIYTTILSLRSTFVLYTAAAVSTVFIALGKRPASLVPAMIYLTIFLIIVLYRAFQRAHSSSVFSQLAQFVRRRLPTISSGDYDQVSTPPTAANSHVTPEQDKPDTPEIPPLYILHVVADFVVQKVAGVARDRKYNALLVLSLLNVVVLTIIVFGLLNWGLYKINPLSFTGVKGNGFLQFLAFSLGQLATSNLTTIQPISPLATVLASVEVFSGLLILVIGAFSILTAARDTYREDFQDFALALHETATAIDQRIVMKYSLTAEELERSIALHSAAAVNFLRRLRGLPELPVHADESGSGERPDDTDHPQIDAEELR